MTLKDLAIKTQVLMIEAEKLGKKPDEVQVLVSHGSSGALYVPEDPWVTTIELHTIAHDFCDVYNSEDIVEGNVVAYFSI